MEIYSDWFINNETFYLKESSHTEDLLSRTDEITKFSNKLSLYPSNSIIWFIWEFWSWKSTFLNQLKNNADKSISKRIEFDAWKYPDRTNLRENFVLESARQLNEDSFDATLKKIDWKQNDDKKTLLNMLYKLPGKWWEFIPWADSIKEGVEYFLNSSPAKRTFEIQNIFIEVLKKFPQNELYFIIEDIDRSGDAWIYFLETLNHFLIKNTFDRKIIKVIVPIGKKLYDENNDSYMKCINHTHTFEPTDMKFTNFIKAIFKEEISNMDYIVGQLSSFFEWIYTEFPEQITIRKLKHIIRWANTQYKLLVWMYGEWIDFRLCILFETAKYINYPWHQLSYLWMFKHDLAVQKSDSIFAALIDCLFQELPHIRNEKNDSICKVNLSTQMLELRESYLSIKIEKRYPSASDRSSIWAMQSTENNRIWISKAYLES